MKKSTNAIIALIVGFAFSQSAVAQAPAPVTISLENFSEFRLPGNNWVIASDASSDFITGNTIKLTAGTGVVVNSKPGSNLVTTAELGDVEIDLDFMVARGATSGIWLQGRYKVMVADSWGKANPTFADMGGIGQPGNSGSAFDAAAPLMNVARAPGLWQHLKIRFIAPRFDASGRKITNARFEDVVLNGVSVQQQVEVSGPSSSGMYSDEKASGPVVFQGDRGAVAFKNIKYTLIPPPAAVPAQGGPRRGFRVVNPILLDAGSKPYLLRSYLNYGNTKRTHVISVGSPLGLNYSYDMKQGALLQAWRGRFADVTDMWEQRGEPQLAKPNGSLVLLSGAPFVAALANTDASWPDSIAFEDLNNKGYVLDSERNPTFKYSYRGAEISDKLSISSDGQSLNRELTVSNAPSGFYSRIAAGKVIEPAGKDMYAIDGKTYYLRLEKRFKPIIRTVPNGQEILVRIDNISAPLSYSIIW